MGAKGKGDEHPYIDNKTNLRNLQHVTVWMIRTYGRAPSPQSDDKEPNATQKQKQQQTEGYSLSFTKTDVREKLVAYLRKYSTSKGEHVKISVSRGNEKNWDYSNYKVQLGIIRSATLRTLSLELLTPSFIGYVRQMIGSKRADDIFATADPNNTGKVRTKKLLKLMAKPALFYQIQQQKIRNQNQNQNQGSGDGKSKQSVRVDHAKIEQSVEHVTIWMIRKYGRMADDKSCRFILTKEAFKNKLADYLEEYVECGGELKK